MVMVVPSASRLPGIQGLAGDRIMLIANMVWVLRACDCIGKQSRQLDTQSVV